MGQAPKGGFCAAQLFLRPSPLFAVPTTAGKTRRFHRRMQNASLGIRLMSVFERAWKIRLSFGGSINSKATRFSSRANNDRKSLSRKERRLFERKERNRAKRKSKMQSSESNNPTFTTTRFWKEFSAERLKSSFEFLAPRLPGRNVSFTHRSLWMALGFRLPLFVALSYAMTNEVTSPYVIQGSLGPSMLPTIQFVGDIWLVETKAWQKAISWVLGRHDEEDLRSMYEIGDLVIWEDTSTGKRSCKRIVGLEGDTVHQSGEHRNLYNSRFNGGILWPKERPRDQVFGAFSRPNNEVGTSESEQQKGGTENRSLKTVVPKQCLWLEGDCPLFSMDSRYDNVYFSAEFP